MDVRQIGFGKCITKNSSCQKTRTELKAAKRKTGFNYKQFLFAKKKVEQLSKRLRISSAVITKLKRTMKGECGESVEIFTNVIKFVI